MTAGAPRRIAVWLAILVFAVPGVPAEAYLKIGTRVGTSTVTLTWKGMPVRYTVSDRGVPGVTAEQFHAAAARAFSTWQDVTTSSATFEFAGFSAARPLDEDGVNTLGFLPRPDLDRVLASTSFLVDTRTGEILESDIFFNSTFPWSVAESGETGRFDIESIALHEIGHFQGLGHSALGETELSAGGGRRLIAAEAVMFPIAYAAGSTIGRTLDADDIAGVSDLYADEGFRQDTGSVQGKVTKNGAGVFGAHVVAFNPRTGTLVGNFTLDDAGTFVIAGLQPGVYVVRAEPLDDGDAESFFDAAGAVDANFKVAFSKRLVAVPRGGASRSIEIKVIAK